MRIAIGGIFHESNTFVAGRTTLADYEAGRLYLGSEMLGPLAGTDTEIGGFLAAAAEWGFEPVPTFYAWAWPGGPLTSECFRTLLDRLVAAIAEAPPVDGLLLTLHGAMVVENEDDPDGLILAESRSGLECRVPLFGTFDFHANLSPLMVAASDALIGYNTYPHVDLFATGREAAGLLVRHLRGDLAPVMSLAKPPLMPHIARQRTADGPMAELMALARAAEQRPGIARVSVAGGFAYADVPRMGMGVLTLADRDGELAAAVAQDLADAAWSRREEFVADLPGPAEGVRRARSAPSGPIVLADLADNVGGGSPGDGTWLLAELVRQLDAREESRETLAGGPDRGPGPPLPTPALVLLADPEAVAQAIAAGVGERVRLTVGGKSDARHGAPVPLEGRVCRIAEGVFRNRGPMRHGLVDDQGRSVVLDCGPLLVVLTERRLPMWNLEQLRTLGIDPTRLGIIVVKGAVAHRAAYGPIASELIEVETDGSCAGDVRKFCYTQVRRPLFPLDRW